MRETASLAQRGLSIRAQGSARGYFAIGLFFEFFDCRLTEGAGCSQAASFLQVVRPCWPLRGAKFHSGPNPRLLSARPRSSHPGRISTILRASSFNQKAVSRLSSPSEDIAGPGGHFPLTAVSSGLPLLLGRLFCRILFQIDRNAPTVESVGAAMMLPSLLRI